MFNRKLHSFTAVLLSAAMVMSLAACAEEKDEAAAVETTAAAAETAAPEATAITESAVSSVSRAYSGTSGSASDYFVPVAESVESFETKTLPFYMMELENESEIEVTYINGYDDIPYVSLETIAQLLKDTFTSTNDAAGDTFSLEVGSVVDDDTVFAMVRENDSTLIIDFSEATLTFSDIDTFVEDPRNVSGLDLVSLTENGGNTMVIHTKAYYRAAGAEVIDLEHYGILPVLQDGVGYLPLQTVADLLYGRIGLYLLCNGEAVMVADTITDPNADTPDMFDDMLESMTGEAAETEEPVEEEDTIENLSDLYYSASKGEKSDALTTFTYNELCMALDYNYGLQDKHSITSFNQLFLNSGLSDRLRSNDAGDVYLGLDELCASYFADSHSGMDAPSYMTDLNTNGEEAETLAMGYNGDTIWNSSYYSLYRDVVMTDGVKGYEEVGDTAYITFDAFVIDSERDYYNTEITNNMDDTVELIIYANQQIKREGSPIKNVVIDLSCNGGGYVDAAVCVLSWMLNGVNLSFVDPISGVEGSTFYQFDANLDGKYDMVNDSMISFNTYNLFAIISPNSFSCGNMTPEYLGTSGRVTLIGRPSSGGACCVMPISTADGNIFQISGPYHLSTVENGSYYSVDRGIEPDIYISNIAHLYDREYMTNLIDNLD